jgi:hypothetical protein
LMSSLINWLVPKSFPRSIFDRAIIKLRFRQVTSRRRPSPPDMVFMNFGWCLSVSQMHLPISCTLWTQSSWMNWTSS